MNFDADGNASSLLRVTWQGVDGLPESRIGPLDAEARLPSLLKRVDWFGTTRDFTLERTKVLREGILPLGAATLRPAYEIEVEGWVSGGGERTSKAPLVVYVDAVDGSLLNSVPALSHAAPPTDTITEQGIVEHYDPHPNAPVHVLPVFDLDSNYHELRSPQARVTNGALLGPAVSPTYQFTPLSWPSPYDYHMADTSAFKAISDFRRSLVAVNQAFILGDYQIDLDALDFNYSFSAYVWATKKIVLNIGGPDAFDRMVPMHEYGHAIQCDVGGGAQYGCALNNGAGGNSTSGSIDEGVADYDASSLHNSVNVYPWLWPIWTGVGNTRTMDSNATLENWFGATGIDSLIWGTALWNLRKSLGSCCVSRSSRQFAHGLWTWKPEAHEPADSRVHELRVCSGLKSAEP